MLIESDMSGQYFYLEGVLILILMEYAHRDYFTRTKDYSEVLTHIAASV